MQIIVKNANTQKVCICCSSSTHTSFNSNKGSFKKISLWSDGSNKQSIYSKAAGTRVQKKSKVDNHKNIIPGKEQFSW